MEYALWTLVYIYLGTQIIPDNVDLNYHEKLFVITLWPVVATVFLFLQLTEGTKK